MDKGTFDREAKRLALAAAASVAFPAALPLYYGARLFRWGTVATVNGVKSTGQSVARRAAESREKRRTEIERREQEEAHEEYIASLPNPPTREDLAALLKQDYDDDVRVIRQLPLDDDEIEAVVRMRRDRYLDEFGSLFV